PCTAPSSVRDLTTQPAFRTPLARATRHIVVACTALFRSRVNRLLELEDLAPDVDRDLLGEVALLDRGGDLGDVADLAGQVAGHDVHVVGQVFPDAADSLDLGLTTQPAFGTDLARDARDLAGDRVELADACLHRLR